MIIATPPAQDIVLAFSLKRTSSILRQIDVRSSLIILAVVLQALLIH